MDHADSPHTQPGTTSPSVSGLGESEGLYVADPIEGVRFEIYTNTEPALTTADPDQFYFPVDTATRVDATKFRVPVTGNPIIRNSDGQLVTDCAPRETVNLQSGEYHIELTGAPMKLYLAAHSSIRLEQGEHQVTIEVDQPPCVLGVRSFHDNPAGTITIPDTPDALQDAVSLLGSALKTHSPERSFPTLRGHPPLIEVGDSFNKPSSIRSPETGVTIVIPSEFKYIFSITSLAYYLGAEVVDGTNPRIIADGEEYPLPRENFHTAVNERLRQLVFLDCLTRTEGYYDIELFERKATADVLELDYNDLYDSPLAVRTAAYLETDLEQYREYLPEWDLTVDIHPTPSRISTLSFVANDLALIRTPEQWKQQEAEALDPESTSTPTAGPDAFTPREAPSIEHVHLGPGYPLGSCKATQTSLKRRIERPEPADETIHVDVICNDDRMREEEVVESIFGERDFLEFDTTVHYNLSTEELAAVLATETDFLHYIGHVDDQGILCTDGYLSVDDVQTVNVEAFLLNACRSYDQGMQLIERGGVGGIVTLGDVSNRPAVQVGRSLARLLNRGFPLRAALLVAKQESLSGHQYVVIGDGQLQLAQCVNGLPWVVEVNGETTEGYDVNVKTFPVKGYGVGSLMAPNIGSNNERYLRPGTTHSYEVSESELQELLDGDNLPIRKRNRLFWSRDVLDGDSVRFS
jgi:hypothetical protein